jgi:ASC-1-like (ASCH) protein
MIHELKTHPQYFSMVFAGTKNFEVRKNDRNFKYSDELILKEFIPEEDSAKGFREGLYTNRA